MADPLLLYSALLFLLCIYALRFDVDLHAMRGMSMFANRHARFRGNRRGLERRHS